MSQTTIFHLYTGRRVVAASLSASRLGGTRSVAWRGNIR